MTTGKNVSAVELAVLEAFVRVDKASGVPSMQAVAVASGMRDDQAERVAADLRSRGLLRVVGVGPEQASQLSQPHYQLTDEGRSALERGAGG